MATEVTMPKLGLTMVDGKIVEWRKKEGEPVAKGEILLVIETEKVTYEVESPESGIVGRIVVLEGETVLVKTVLTYILQPGETMAEIPGEKKGKEEVQLRAKAAVPSSVSRVAQRVEGVQANEEVSEQKVNISPLAKKLAEEQGLDVSKIRGSGPGGRIVREDILKVISEVKSKSALASPQAEEVSTTKARLLPLTGMRRTIARRMSHSFQTAPHLWVHIKVDATELKKAREQLQPTVEAETGEKLTYTDLIVKMVGRALEDYPIINSRWADNGIEILEDINIGIATSVTGGLVVPVIHQANKKSLAEITRIRADIVQRGREGKLGIDEMTGSTITITNLGMAGVAGGNPILNPPEAAILALGAIAEEPMVVDGQVAVRLCLNLTLAVDHRVLDGFIAAQFLNRIKELTEQYLLIP